MADKDTGGSDGSTGNDMMWFLGIVLIVWVIWFVTGGPGRYDKTKPFLKPPSPIDTGETYGPVKQ
jgi:hypothetical protein